MDYKLYKLDNGRVIVTPFGKPITEEEFLRYFDAASSWLKEVRPSAYRKISPDPKNEKTSGWMLCKMFNAYLYDPEVGGVKERHPLDERVMAFIYVLSYYVQASKSESIDPFLSHTMGNTLLEWLPIPELVEGYLSESAEIGKGCNLSDALRLTELYCPKIIYEHPSFRKDLGKALKYGKWMYENPFNDHGVNHYDYVYAFVLFLNGSSKESMAIVLDKLNQEVDEERMGNLLAYLSLGLEIEATDESQTGRISLSLAEELIEEGKADHPYFARKCEAWLDKLRGDARLTRKE